MFSRKHVECEVEIEGKRLTNIREQAYLGVALSEDGKMECELEQRIGAAMRAAVAVRSQVFENSELGRSAKMLAYDGMI